MPWHCGTTAIGWVTTNRVPAAFTIQNTTVSPEVSNQLPTLHAVGTSTSIDSQMTWPGASLRALSR
jgi:hypothetical protein